MRAILSLAIAAVFLAFAGGWIVADQPAPMFIRVIVGLFGLLMLLGGLYHGWLRLRGRAALHGGREKRGTLRLAQVMDDDDLIARLVFDTNFSSWAVDVDVGGLRGKLVTLTDTVPATAYLADDERIFSLVTAERKLVLMSPGRLRKPGSLRQKV